MEEIPKRVFFYCDYEHDSDIAMVHTDDMIQVSIIRITKSKVFSEVSETPPLSNRRDVCKVFMCQVNLRSANLAEVIDNYTLLVEVIWQKMS